MVGFTRLSKQAESFRNKTWLTTMLRAWPFAHAIPLAVLPGWTKFNICATCIPLLFVQSCESPRRRTPSEQRKKGQRCSWLT
jgi:hypothetical protein